LSLLHFVNLFPHGAICLIPPFNLSILLLSLSLSLSLSITLSRSSSHSIEPISLVLFLPLSIWLSCGACTISISCGYPVADSRHESRHHPAGVRRGNAKRQTGSPSPSTSVYPTSLSLSLSLSLFLRISICISFSLIAYHSLSLSFSPFFSFSPLPLAFLAACLSTER